MNITPEKKPQYFLLIMLQLLHVFMVVQIKIIAITITMKIPFGQGFLGAVSST